MKTKTEYVWRSMDSAPRDGTVIIVRDREHILLPGKSEEIIYDFLYFSKYKDSHGQWFHEWVDMENLGCIPDEDVGDNLVWTNVDDGIVVQVHRD